MANEEVEPEPTAEKEEVNFDDGSYYSDSNVWFNNYKYEPIDINDYDQPIRASDHKKFGSM